MTRPTESLSTVTVYVDETYLDLNTGVLHAAIPIQKQSEPVVDKAVTDIRKSYAYIQIAEFKASSIKKGNAPVYVDFLQRMVNVCAQIGDQSILRPIVTVEGVERHNYHSNVDWLRSQVAGAIATLGAIEEPHLVTEFSRQMWWIYRFMDRICPSRVENDFSLVFDNKYRYAQRFQASKAIMHNGLAILWEGWKMWTGFANTVLSELAKKGPGKWFPRISRLGFGLSQNSHLLQACDLVANLVYNALKYELGIVSDVTTLKREMLGQVMPTFEATSDLKNALEVRPSKDGAPCLCAKDTSFSCCLQLDPV